MGATGSQQVCTSKREAGGKVVLRVAGLLPQEPAGFAHNMQYTRGG